MKIKSGPQCESNASEENRNIPLKEVVSVRIGEGLLGKRKVWPPMRDKEAPDFQPNFKLSGVIYMPRSKVYNLSDNDFRDLVARNHSWCACAREIGLSPNGSNSKIQLKKRIEELGLDISHFD